jgi:hypothetical protein
MATTNIKDATIEEAFESYIAGKYINDDQWGAESEYRQSLKLIEDSGIDVKTMKLSELNSVDNINKIFAENENLLAGKTTTNVVGLDGKPINYNKTNVNALGNNIQTILNNLRSGEANEFTIWNKENASVPNPLAAQLGKKNVPYPTLGFKLTERDKKGLILLAPDDVMVKAFYDTLDSIEDVTVGNRVIPKKVVQAHALLTFITGMRQTDTNRLLTTIDPEGFELEEDLADTKSKKSNNKTFLLSDIRSLYINNKGKKTVYGLTPFLYSILEEAVKDQEPFGARVFGTGTEVQKHYTDLFKEKLRDLLPEGSPLAVQLNDGIRKPIAFTPRLFRKFSYSFARRLYMDDAGGQGMARANALIQHEGRSAQGSQGIGGGKNVGEQHYFTGQMGVFQKTDATLAQEEVTDAILSQNPDGRNRTPLTFLRQLRFNPIGQIFGKQSGVERASNALARDLRDQFEEFVLSNFDDDQHGDILSQFNSKDEFLKEVSDFTERRKLDGVIVDPLNNTTHLQSFLDDDTPIMVRRRRSPTVSQQRAPSEKDQNVQDQLKKLGVGENFVAEGAELKDLPDQTRAKNIYERVLEAGKKGAKAAAKKAPVVALGAFTGGTSFIPDAAAMALEPSVPMRGNLPSDQLDAARATPTSELTDSKGNLLTDEQLAERMQDSLTASRTFSPDLIFEPDISYERAIGLENLRRNTEGFAARAFDAPARMRAEQADLTELDYTTPELERMRLSKTVQQEVEKDVETEINERIQRAKIAAEAAEDFNRVN